MISTARQTEQVDNAGRTLRWFIEDVWGNFDTDHTRPCAPLFPSERKDADGTCRRVGDDALRAGLGEAAAAHLPSWAEKLTPHVLRHFCVISPAWKPVRHVGHGADGPRALRVFGSCRYRWLRSPRDRVDQRGVPGGAGGVAARWWRVMGGA
jgi:hypothetical protein